MKKNAISIARKFTDIKIANFADDTRPSKMDVTRETDKSYGRI